MNSRTGFRYSMKIGKGEPSCQRSTRTESQPEESRIQAGASRTIKTYQLLVTFIKKVITYAFLRGTQMSNRTEIRH